MAPCNSNEYFDTEERLTYKCPKQDPWMPRWLHAVLLSVFVGGCLVLVIISYEYWGIEIYVSFYGLSVMSFYLTQLIFAECHRRYCLQNYTSKLDEKYRLGIQIIGYHEELDIFKKKEFQMILIRKPFLLYVYTWKIGGGKEFLFIFVQEKGWL